MKKLIPIPSSTKNKIIALRNLYDNTFDSDDDDFSNFERALDDINEVDFKCLTGRHRDLIRKLNSIFAKLKDAFNEFGVGFDVKEYE